MDPVQKMGDVREIFISKHRNKGGRRYGFVRFKVVSDERSLGIWSAASNTAPKQSALAMKGSYLDKRQCSIGQILSHTRKWSQQSIWMPDNGGTHCLQYADDTIFFGEATMQNVRAIKTMLRSFELVSGLKINFAKSSFGALGKSDQWQKEAAENTSIAICCPCLSCIWASPLGQTQAVATYRIL